MSTPNTKYAPSVTLERRLTVYPTPQNEIKINKYVEDHKESNISKNQLINDAVKHYFANVLHI